MPLKQQLLLWQQRSRNILDALNSGNEMNRDLDELSFYWFAFGFICLRMLTNYQSQERRGIMGTHLPLLPACYSKHDKSMERGLRERNRMKVGGGKWGGTKRLKEKEETTTSLTYSDSFSSTWCFLFCIGIYI